MRHREVTQCERSHFAYLNEEPVDCSGLRQAISLHCEVEVAVVFDRVAVGIEQGCVPVAERFVPFGAVERQSDVATGEVQFRILARHDDHRCFGVGAMVA